MAKRRSAMFKIDPAPSWRETMFVTPRPAPARKPKKRRIRKAVKWYFIVRGIFD